MFSMDNACFRCGSAILTGVNGYGGQICMCQTFNDATRVMDEIKRQNEMQPLTKDEQEILERALFKSVVVL